jgi:hypothetical protein
MVSLQIDPDNPNKIILSATVTLLLERTLLETLNSAVTDAIRAQAKKDLKGNKEVQREISQAATRLLLGMLGVTTGAEEPKDGHN